MQSQILIENFDGAWSPSPSGWLQEETQSGTGGYGDNQFWQQLTYDGGWPQGYGTPPAPISGNSVAWYNDYDAEEGQVDLFYTDDIDLSLTTNPTVSFYFYYYAGSSSRFKFIASNDGGSTWNDISGAIEPPGAVWKKFTFSLPAEYKVANARIGFEWTAYYGSYDLYIDSVVLIDAPPALTGIKTIDNTLPTAGDNYNSFTDAFDALNTSGVGDGGVTFHVTEGQVFNENPPDLIVHGADTKPIVFTNSGTPGTNNPVIQSEGVGSNDYSVRLFNTSYVTFNGIDINCKNTNYNSELRLEYGLILDYDCTNNSFLNGKIDLNNGNDNYTTAVYILRAGNNYNTFDNSHITDCSCGFLLGDLNDYDDDIGNSITNCTIDNLTSPNINSVVGIDVNYQSDMIISGNTITNMHSTESPLYGILIHNGYSTDCQIFNNSISDLYHQTYQNRFLAGIYLLYGYSGVYQNEIFNLTNEQGDVCGIANSAYGTTYAYKNDIHDIKYTGSSNFFASGIFAEQSLFSYFYVYNNLIYDIQASNAITDTDSPVSSAGLYFYQGTNYVYFNTVFLNDTANSSTYKSAALYILNHYTDVDFRNNIFVNKTSGIFNKAAAFYHNSTDYSDINTVSDNNLYYAGSPSASTPIFFDGANTAQSLGDYKTLVSNFDEYSLTEDVTFMSDEFPFDVHVSLITPTQIESAGAPVITPVSINEDFDGTQRNATTPDIGAFEADYILADLTDPAISYNLINNTMSTDNYILTDFVEITDATGVDTINLPRLYYKNYFDDDVFGGNTNADNGWKYVVAENTTSPFSFTIDYSILYDDGVAEEGDIFVYFIVAQDSTGVVNVGSNPDDGFQANSVDDIISAPSTPNFYFIGNIYYDFEADNDQRFTHEPAYGYTIDEWERGTPTAGDNYPQNLPSGISCWGTDLDSNYANYQEFILYSPLFEATDKFFMFDFAEFLHIEDIPFDSVGVEFIVNNFLWYQFGDTYSRQDTAWQHQVHYIPTNAGDRVQLAWHFYSDISTSYAGWFIDDLIVRGAKVMYNANFTVVDQDSLPIAYPHIWMDGDDDQWYGNQDGTKTIPLSSGTHSYIVNGPQHDYLPTVDTFEITDNDTNIYIVLYPMMFDVTFDVTDNFLMPVEGADVYFNYTHYYTDENGQITITNITPGVYSYSVYYADYCSTETGTITITDTDYTEYVTLLCADLVNENDNKFSVYPNPADDFITISSINNIYISNIQIVDSKGVVVLSQNINSTRNIVDVKNLKPGSYILKVFSDEVEYSTKIIIK